MFPDFEELAKRAEIAAVSIVGSFDRQTAEQRETNEKLDRIIELLEQSNSLPADRSPR